MQSQMIEPMMFPKAHQEISLSTPHILTHLSPNATPLEIGSNLNLAQQPRSHPMYRVVATEIEFGHIAYLGDATDSRRADLPMRISSHLLSISTCLIICLSISADGTFGLQLYFNSSPVYPPSPISSPSPSHTHHFPSSFRMQSTYTHFLSPVVQRRLSLEPNISKFVFDVRLANLILSLELPWSADKISFQDLHQYSFPFLAQIRPRPKSSMEENFRYHFTVLFDHLHTV